MGSYAGAHACNLTYAPRSTGWRLRRHAQACAGLCRHRRHVCLLRALQRLPKKGPTSCPEGSHYLLQGVPPFAWMPHHHWMPQWIPTLSPQGSSQQPRRVPPTRPTQKWGSPMHHNFVAMHSAVQRPSAPGARQVSTRGTRTCSTRFAQGTRSPSLTRCQHWLRMPARSPSSHLQQQQQQQARTHMHAGRMRQKRWLRPGQQRSCFLCRSGRSTCGQQSIWGPTARAACTDCQRRLHSIGLAGKAVAEQPVS